MPRPHGADIERNCYESLLIVLDTLEQCLSRLPKDTAKFDEAMNVKLLLRELCQFIGNELRSVFSQVFLAKYIIFSWRMFLYTIKTGLLQFFNDYISMGMHACVKQFIHGFSQSQKSFCPSGGPMLFKLVICR